MSAPTTTTKGDAVTAVEPMPFHMWLSEHRDGVATDEWAAELAAVLEMVRLTGKKGSLSITIAVEPKGRSVVVTDKVEAKPPKPDPEVAIYFIGDDGSLVRDDPTQQRLWPQVDPTTGEIGVQEQ